MFFSSFKIITFSHLNYTNFKDSFKGNFMRVKMNKMVSKDKPLDIYKTTPKKALGNNVEIRQNLIFDVSTSNRRQFGVVYLLGESSCKLKLKLEKITSRKFSHSIKLVTTVSLMEILNTTDTKLS